MQITIGIFVYIDFYAHAGTGSIVQSKLKQGTTNYRRICCLKLSTVRSSRMGTKTSELETRVTWLNSELKQA